MIAKFRGVLGLVLLTIALSACSLVQAVLPDQEVTVTDPIALDGAVITAAFIGSFSLPSDAIGVQQTGADLSGSVSGIQVPEIDTSEFRGFSPVRFSVDVGFETTAELHSASATDPAELADTLALTYAALAEFTIEDGSVDSPVSFGGFTTPATTSVTLTKNSCVSGPTGVTCTYTLSGDVEGFVIPFELTGGDLGELLDILSNEVTPNELAATVDLKVEGSVPTDAELSVTFDAPTGTLVF